MKAVLLVLLFSFSATASFAEKLDAGQELLKQLGELPAFQSGFTQDVYDERGKLIQGSSGNFYFDGARRLNNTIEKPEHLTLLSDGEKLWQIDYELEQVSITRLEKSIGDSPLALLLEGNSKVLESYHTSLERIKGGKQKIYKLSSSFWIMNF